MRWLSAPMDYRRIATIARIQNNLDFQAGWKAYLTDLKTELSLKSANIKDDVEYRQNQGRLQAIIDLLVLCEKAHDWALAAQSKIKR